MAKQLPCFAAPQSGAAKSFFGFSPLDNHYNMHARGNQFAPHDEKKAKPAGLCLLSS